MTGKINKKQLYKESLIITILIMLITLLLQYFPMNFEIAKPLKEEFNDFDVYDIIYSGESANNHSKDTNILILQAADTRREIASQINLVQKYHPAVIGIDLTFIGNSQDLEADSILKKEITRQNVVTGNKIEIDSNTGIEKVIPNYFDDPFLSSSGYINFWGEDIAVVRYYPPFKTVNNDSEYAITSRIVEKYDAKAFSVLKKKYQKIQVINYRGNIESYPSFTNGNFDTTQFGEKIKGKIVLLGVLYNQFPLVLEDIHFTPLNDRLNGKSFPDMYGVVIHANILSMILSNKYIISAPRIWSYLIAIVLAFLLVHYQLRSHYLGKHPSDLSFFLMQFIMIIILVFIFLQIYKQFQYKFALFPIVMPIVLCIEMIEVYKFLIKKFFKRSKYKSVYLNKG